MKTSMAEGGWAHTADQKSSRETVVASGAEMGFADPFLLSATRTRAAICGDGVAKDVAASVRRRR